MVDIFNKIIGFISVNVGAIAPVLCAIVTLAHLTVFLLEIVMAVFLRKKQNAEYFLVFSGICLILSAYFAIEDFSGLKTVFSTEKKVYVFISALSVLSLLWFTAIKLSGKLYRKKQAKAPTIIERQPQAQTSCERVETLLDANGELSGYLSVSHVKSLISELKTKPLSETDARELEEFEVYLLNFVTRQTSPPERKVLSGYLSELIKKTSRYA